MKYEICPCCGKPKRPKTRFKSARECIVGTGAGALNIDGARIPINDDSGVWGTSNETVDHEGRMFNSSNDPDYRSKQHQAGRWPANFYLDEEGARRLGEQSGELKSGANPERRGSDKFRSTYQPYEGQRECVAHRGADSGSAARFFFNVNRQIDEADPVMYHAKASRKERDAGLDCERVVKTESWNESTPLADRMHGKTTYRNNHPTIKPIDLTRWLATLLLPPSEYGPRRILIPFSGVMSEAIGAMMAGWEHIVAIEMDKEYVRIGRERMKWWAAKMQETGSYDPRAILGTCGTKGKAKLSCEENWQNGSLFQTNGEE